MWGLRESLPISLLSEFHLGFIEGGFKVCRHSEKLMKKIKIHRDGYEGVTVTVANLIENI